MSEPIAVTYDVPDNVDPLPVYLAPGGREVYFTDHPVLLSDGVSLMQPIPVVDAGGAVWIDRVGKPQDAVPIVSLPPP